VIAVSTGGPQALSYLIPQLPTDFPIPVAIVLHMPVGYTAMYAEHLNQQAALTVREAHLGQPLEAGHVYIAPAGRHLVLQRQGDRVVVQLNLYPLDLPHRPSADVLFQSAAEVYGDRVLGLVMTGMGNDGTQGAAWIKARGGTIFTEAAESCVVYGMPRSVEEAGLSDRTVPLTALGAVLLATI
jgi:two-component system chemotaxis response regulator CheB